MLTQIRVQNKHIYIILGLFFLFCFKYYQNSKIKIKDEEVAFIKIAKVVSKHKEIRLSAPSILEPIGTVDIKTRIDGIIKDIKFKEGEIVNVGSTLIELDNDLINAEIKGAYAELERFKKQLEKSSKSLKRSQSLLKKNVTTEAQNDTAVAEFEDDRFQIKNQEAKIKSLEVERSYHSIKAPIQGKVSFENIDKGNYIKVSDNLTIAKVVDTQKLRIFVPIPEKFVKYFHKVNLNKVQINFFDSSNKVLKTDVIDSLTDQILDHKTGIFRLKFILDNKEEFLKSGSIVRSELKVDDSTSYISVPESALNMTNEGAFFYTFSKKKNEVSKVFFKDFLLMDGEIYVHPSEIKLKQGDYVVVSGQVKLNNGQKKYHYDEVKRA